MGMKTSWEQIRRPITLCDFEQQIMAGDGMNKSGTHPAKSSLVSEAVSPATLPMPSPRFQLSLLPRL